MLATFASFMLDTSCLCNELHHLELSRVVSSTYSVFSLPEECEKPDSNSTCEIVKWVRNATVMVCASTIIELKAHWRNRADRKTHSPIEFGRATV